MQTRLIFEPVLSAEELHGFSRTVAGTKLEEVATLTFEPVNREKFPCLGHAYRALEAGGALPAVLNAANEVAVCQFLGEAIRFDQIPEVIARAMDRHPARPITSVEDVLEADRAVRRFLDGGGPR